MSDRLRFLEALRRAGSAGLHSHTARREGLTGHPSERAAELTREGYTIRREREYIDGRNGVRFYLEGEPVGISTGVPTPQGPGGFVLSPDRASADSSETTGDRVGSQGVPGPDLRASERTLLPRAASSPVSGELVPLFEPEPERPMSAFTTPEAA